MQWKSLWLIWRHFWAWLCLTSTTYSTAQGNISTSPRHILCVFQTCPAHILDVSHTCSGHILCLAKKTWQLRKSCCNFIARFCACTDMFRAHSRCNSRVFQTHLACISDVVTLELSCTVRRYHKVNVRLFLG